MFQMRSTPTLIRVAQIALLLWTLVCASMARAADGSREDQFKAAYLFNFVKFVDWPVTVIEDVLTLCFIGGDGVHDALAVGIDAKRAGARGLAVRRLAAGAAVDGCHVLYVEANAMSDTRIAAANELAILTVSDATAFNSRGGIIELFADSNRLRFNINVTNAQRSGLKISSSLLQLAAVVQKGDRQ